MELITKPKETMTESPNDTDSKNAKSSTDSTSSGSVAMRSTGNSRKKSKLKSKRKKVSGKNNTEKKGSGKNNSDKSNSAKNLSGNSGKDSLKKLNGGSEIKNEVPAEHGDTDEAKTEDGAIVQDSKNKKRLKKKKVSVKPAKPEKKTYDEKLIRHKRAARRKRLIGLAIVLVVAGLVFLYIQKKTYHNYRIIQVSEQEDVISTQYMEMNGKILRFSPDDVSLVTNKLETLWSETHTMQNPIAHVAGNRAVVADRDGTTIEMYDQNGRTGTVSTSYSIVKVKVSKSGLVAAVLDNGSDTWINYYSYDGSLIAENQTKIDDPGYPMDIAVSDDGDVLMVAYQFVDGGDTTSYVAFYNFGDVGQNKDDRIVFGKKYEGVVIPVTEFLGSSHSVAVRDDGFTLYQGKQIPEESKTVQVDNEIISVFYDENLVGLVFKNNDKEKQYRMEVYDINGNKRFEKEFNIPYTTIKMSDGYIIMYNSSQICIMNSSGNEKYTGTVDGNISNLFKIGWNRYLMVMDNGVNIVKLT